jgi:O-antigen/teichoic acid export membrane protein
MKFKQLNNPLIKNSFVYVVCDGINKAIPFLILPFLSYYLSTEDYGIVTNFGVLLNILIVFSSSTINLLLSKFYRLGITERKSFISNIVLLNILSIIAEAVICLPLNHIIENGLGLPLNFQIYCLIATLFSAITTINMAIWRCEEKPLYFGAFQISRSLVNAATAILLVIIFLLGWKGRVYGMVFTHVLFGILSCVIL